MHVCVGVCVCVCSWAVSADLVGFEILVMCDVAMEVRNGNEGVYLHGRYGGVFG